MPRPPPPRTPISSSSTPAISAKRRPRRSIRSSAASASSSERGGAGRPQAHRRGRGLRGPGRGRGDRPPRARGRHRGRAAELPPAAGAAGAGRARRQGRRHRVPGRGQVRSPRAAPRLRRPAPAASPPSSPSRRAATSSAPSASCPIRAAPRCRARSRRSSPRSSASPRPGVREITLIGQNVNAYHGEGPDGRPATLADLLQRARRSAGHARGCATPRAIRATWTTSLIAAHRDLAAADAAAASAGAVGLRPHPCRHEPPPQPRRLSRSRRTAARRPARHRASPRISSSAFRARPRRISATRCASSTRSAMRARSRSNIRRGPARRRPTRDDQVAEAGQDRAPRAAAGPRSTATSAPSTRPAPGEASTCCSRSRAGIPARWSDVRPICSPCKSWRRHP